jgi:hypothetical protein
MTKGIPRRAAKRDANEAEIVEALTRCGATVVRLSQKGVPDLLVGYGGMTFLAEVKSATGKLSAEQGAFQNRWNGMDVVVLRGADEAVSWVSNLARAFSDGNGWE